jgi:hypothetical protein
MAAAAERWGRTDVDEMVPAMDSKVRTK